MSNSNMQEIYEVNPNDKYFYRHFDLLKLNKSQEGFVESNPTILIALLNICSENLKKGDWAEENLNLSKTNIEALLRLLNSVTQENLSNKTFDKISVYNYFDRTVNYLGDESLVSNDINSLAKKILSINSGGKPSHICDVLMKLLTHIDEQYQYFFSKDSVAAKSRYGKISLLNNILFIY